VCISWTIKCLILLMHSAAMKFGVSVCNLLHIVITKARENCHI